MNENWAIAISFLWPISLFCVAASVNMMGGPYWAYRTKARQLDHEERMRAMTARAEREQRMFEGSMAVHERHE